MSDVFGLRKQSPGLSLLFSQPKAFCTAHYLTAIPYLTSLVSPRTSSRARPKVVPDPTRAVATIGSRSSPNIYKTSPFCQLEGRGSPYPKIHMLYMYQSNPKIKESCPILPPRAATFQISLGINSHSSSNQPANLLPRSILPAPLARSPCHHKPPEHQEPSSPCSHTPPFSGCRRADESPPVPFLPLFTYLSSSNLPALFVFFSARIRKGLAPDAVAADDRSCRVPSPSGPCLPRRG